MKFSYQKLPIHQSADPSAKRVARPYLPVYLHGKAGSTESPFYALLDSGADNILMHVEFADVVGIPDIQLSKTLGRVVGVGGQTSDVYFHDVEIQVAGLDKKFSVSVGFGDDIEVPLLGRSFFKNFKQVIFDEKKERVELKI